jgi:hypothetical protein
MATTVSTVFGSRTAFTITLNSLANVTYVAATAVDLHNIVGSATAPLKGNTASQGESLTNAMTTLVGLLPDDLPRSVARTSRTFGLA